MLYTKSLKFYELAQTSVPATYKQVLFFVTVSNLSLDSASGARFHSYHHSGKSTIFFNTAFLVPFIRKPAVLRLQIQPSPAIQPHHRC
jgi:hypothetical protein